MTMRKGLMVLSLLLVVCIVGIGAAFACVNPAKDQIIYTQRTVMGDEALAVGLTADVRYTYSGNLYWFSSHRPGQGSGTETEFQFHSTTPNFPSTHNYYGVEMQVVGDPWNVDWENLLMQAEESEIQGLLKAYRDLAQQTPAGKVTNTYIRYADYCEYYPLSGYLDYPGSFWPFWHIYEDSVYDTSGGETAKAFNDYFQIPVLEDDWVQIVVDKRESGYYMDSIDASYPRKGADYYEMRAVGVNAGDRIYFTFDPHTVNGALVDTSHIPGGYGLYALSLKKDDRGNPTPDLSALTTLRPLDPAHSPEGMTVDREYNHLLLKTRVDNIYYMTVIDLDTLETLQQFEMMRLPEDRYYWLRQQEDFIACFLSETSVAVFQRNAQGLYDHCFTAPLSAENNVLNNIDHYYSAIDFNGEYLAVASDLRFVSDPQKYFNTEVQCGYALALYGKDGLVYYGEYTSSLESPLPEEYQSRSCRVDEVQIQWD